VAYVDLCRGPHVPSTGKLGVQAHEGRRPCWRGEKARCSAHLRMRGRTTRPQGVPAGSRRRSGATTAARRELDLFSFPRSAGSRSSTPRAARSPDHGGVLRQRHIEAGYDPSTHHTSRSRTPSGGGHLSCTPRACTRRWSSTAARTTTSSR
jgi:threonyl-tRNA synthetase